jgi:conjugative transfer region protein TrbK
MAATAITLALDEHRAPAVPPAPSVEAVETDPLKAELARCRGLEAGTEDIACEQAWEEHRRRFFVRGRRDAP